MMRLWILLGLIMGITPAFAGECRILWKVSGDGSHVTAPSFAEVRVCGTPGEFEVRFGAQPRRTVFVKGHEAMRELARGHLRQAAASAATGRACKGERLLLSGEDGSGKAVPSCLEWGKSSAGRQLHELARALYFRDLR